MDAPAEEIAEDFRHSLEFLQTPDRYSINNFTVIAKENTEHADAISNVLVEHIRKAPPHHKLPALYVLDSIAKNIGTPYTLFLGHKLYAAFMGAYSSVDTTTRKKLDEMLKTWKSPVPGSIDPTPVFPPEITKRIENALIQAKTAALRHDQAQNHILQKRPASALAMQWRNTPTPPQQNLQYSPPQPQPFHQQHPPNAGFVHQNTINTATQPLMQAYPQQQYQSSTPIPQHFTPIPPQSAFEPSHAFATSQFQPPPPVQISYPQYGQTSIQMPDMGALHQDIDHLISMSREKYPAGSSDPREMKKLSALLALKNALSRQTLSMDQYELVRRQVDDLKSSEQRESGGRSQVATPVPSMIQHFAQGYGSTSQPVAQTSAPVGSQGFSSGTTAASDLAALLRKATGGSTPSFAPSMAGAGPSIGLQSTQTNVSSLLANLAKQGVLSQQQPQKSTSVQSRGVDVSASKSLQDLLALATGSTAATKNDDLQLNSASLKIPRPNLLHAMLDRRRNQCVNCGLRFDSSENGKKNKERHMDWHFRANQRISDASKAIQSRSWFVGEMEWIKFKDLEDQHDSQTTDQNAVSGGAPSASASKYVSVPSDPEAHQPCPICQERFDTGFNQDIQDWVWLDAIRVGTKIFHATCYADLRRDGQETRAKTATPDSVLGKRKAEISSTDVSPAKKAIVGN